MESRKFALLSLVLLVLFVLAPAPAAGQTTHIVTVGDNFFNPSNLTIQVGDTVEWRNAAGGNVHNVVANNGSFTSPSGSSFTFTQTFNAVGNVNYHCNFHGGMTGVVNVQGGTTTAPDIAVQSVNAENGTYEPGDSIDIDITLQNVGDASSGSFEITYYASTNTTINTSDTELGSDNRPSLNAGQSSSFSATGTLPVNLAPGNYFIGARVTVTNDSDSGNNTNHDPTTITVQGAPAPFQINAGLNDSWFNPATGGQGFFITVFPDIQKMFLAWFTYDTQRPPGTVTAMLGDPGHRWLTAFGDYSGDTATLAVELTEGGIFATSPPVPGQTADGTITVEFTGCNAGTVTFNIPSASTSGTVAIQRIALDNVPFCETLQ